MTELRIHEHEDGLRIEALHVQDLPMPLVAAIAVGIAIGPLVGFVAFVWLRRKRMVEMEAAGGELRTSFRIPWEDEVRVPVGQVVLLAHHRVWRQGVMRHEQEGLSAFTRQGGFLLVPGLREYQTLALIDRLLERYPEIQERWDESVKPKRGLLNWFGD